MKKNIGMVEIVKDVFVEVAWLNRHNEAVIWDEEAYYQTAGKVYTLEEKLAEKERRKSFFAYLEELRKAGDWDTYSDLYKDRYGIRPHW